MAEYVTLAIFVIGLFVEIAPVKINPISWLGKKLNKATLDKIEALERKVEDNDIDTVRNRILANESLIRKGEHLKRYQYISLMKDIDKWNAYHLIRPELNGLLKIAIQNIEEAYKNEKFDD